jgi:protein-S-isoprenylcysteine O-methyltransferase Ste14
VTAERSFRVFLLLGFTALVAVTFYHRVRAAGSKESLDRRLEGRFILATLRPVSAVLWSAVIAYLINPNWMAWASIPLPLAVRWMGVCVLASGIGLLAWTLNALGRNFTDTVATRNAHTLVTHGPYRFVRHPFYDVMGLLVLSMAIIAANWFILLTGIAMFGLLALRSTTEEAQLLARFGDVYREYLLTTGRFLPRAGR